METLINQWFQGGCLMVRALFHVRKPIPERRSSAERTWAGRHAEAAEQTGGTSSHLQNWQAKQAANLLQNTEDQQGSRSTSLHWSWAFAERKTKNLKIRAPAWKTNLSSVKKGCDEVAERERGGRGIAGCARAEGSVIGCFSKRSPTWPLGGWTRR